MKTRSSKKTALPLAMALALGGTSLSLPACSSNEGGDRVDEAMEEVQDELKDAKEELEDEIDDRS